MIVADPSEKHHIGDQLGYYEELKPVYAPGLEEITGADLMITPLDIPFAPRFLQDHIEAGALLVQRKTGSDLIASIGDRMASSLARMLSTGARQGQCILVFLGTLNVGDEGTAVINGVTHSHYGPQTYWMVQSALERWNECGGVITMLSRTSLFPGWLIMKNRHVKDFTVKTKMVVYDATDQLFEMKPNDPLRELVLVKDWRTTLMTIPGLGPKKIDALYQAMQVGGYDMTLLQALTCLTDPSIDLAVPGVGKGIIAKVREWMGLQDGFNMEVRLDGEPADFG